MAARRDVGQSLNTTMANVASTDVTILAGGFPLGDRFQKDMQESQLDVSVVLDAAGDGTSTHLIPASAFGMWVIREVSGIVKSDNSVILKGSPTASGDGILLSNAGSNAPAQYTGTFNMRVKGQVL